MGKLDSKVAVVTGGSSGIGRATAISLAAEGAERILREQPGVFLAAQDIANAVLYAVTQPPSVQVDEVLVRPSVGLSLGG